MTVTKLRAAGQSPDHGLALGELPDELIVAETALAEAVATRARVTADFDSLNMNYDNLGLRRADGSLFPSEGRAQCLADLFNARREAERAEGAARARVNHMRQTFGDAETARIEAPGNVLCAELRERLEGLERLLDGYAAFQAEARSRSIAVRHSALDAAMNFRGRLHALRGALIPPTKFEGRK